MGISLLLHIQHYDKSILCGLVRTHLQRNIEDVGSIPSIGRYKVAWLSAKSGIPLLLGVIPSGRLKNLNDVHKRSWLSLSVLVR